MLRTLKRYFITFILLFVFVSILPHTVQASESNNGTKILHKVNTSRPNFPTRYNISLNKESDIFFETDQAALEAYKNDPRHKAVSALCKSIRTDRAAVDCLLPDPEE